MCVRRAYPGERKMRLPRDTEKEVEQSSRGLIGCLKVLPDDILYTKETIMKTIKYIQTLFLGISMLSLSLIAHGISWPIPGAGGSIYHRKISPERMQQLAQLKKACALKTCPIGQKPYFVSRVVKCICVNKAEAPS